MDRQAFGRAGEEMARRFLERMQYRFVAERYTGGGGEIDLICYDGDQLVFVEVKVRSSETHGTPFEAVTSVKRIRMEGAALAYMQERDIITDNYRFDVIGIVMGDEEPYLRHWKAI